ncbi:MAG: hypothetical protein ACI8P0_005269 [Planctomycetaceae bacterium]
MITEKAMSADKTSTVLYHLLKGLWKGIPVIGPIVEEVVFEAHKDELTGRLEDAGSGLSEENIETLKQIVNSAGAAIEDSLRGFEGEIGHLRIAVDESEFHIRSDIASIKDTINSLRELIEESTDMSTRTALFSQLQKLEQQRLDWIARISMTQRHLLAAIPESENLCVRRGMLMQTAAANSDSLKRARFEEMNFRLHELRWLGLIDRSPAGKDDGARRDWNYWRTDDGNRLAEERSPQSV